MEEKFDKFYADWLESQSSRDKEFKSDSLWIRIMCVVVVVSYVLDLFFV